jgi:hypothetical protein
LFAIGVFRITVGVASAREDWILEGLLGVLIGIAGIERFWSKVTRPIGVRVTQNAIRATAVIASMVAVCDTIFMKTPLAVPAVVLTGASAAYFACKAYQAHKR